MASKAVGALRAVFAAAIVAAGGVLGGAQICDFNGVSLDVEYWAGAGENSAIVVVDFDGENIFNFGYRWDGSASGWDAISAIGQVEDGLVVESHYDGGVGGMFIDDLIYGQTAKWSGGTGWGYFTSENGTDWFLSWSGVSDRGLFDYDWDGFAWGGWRQDEQGMWVTRAPGEPVAEPSVLLLLGCGAVFLRRLTGR